MDVRKLKNKFIEANMVTDDTKVIFRVPDCKTYDDCHCHIASINGNGVLVIDLIDKIEPKFKVGDIVTNASGLYPDVKCTITTVDKEKQLYYFRETAGTTNFKDQDKLMLVNGIKPKFKVGDKLINVNGLFPDRSYTIAEVNQEKQYYTYREVKGRTYFKDQNKLILVKGEEVRPPVEGEDKLDILAKSYTDVIISNTLKYNTQHYPHIANMINIITRASNEGKISCSFIFPDKMVADDSGVYYEEDEICNVIRWHFDKLGYNIKENVNDKDNYVEFIISW